MPAQDARQRGGSRSRERHAPAAPAAAGAGSEPIRSSSSASAGASEARPRRRRREPRLELAPAGRAGGSVRTAATRPPETKNARRSPPRTPGRAGRARARAGARARRGAATTSSSAAIRSRSRAASSKRSSDESRRRLARDAAAAQRPALPPSRRARARRRRARRRLLERPVRARRLGHAPARAAAAQVDVAVGSHAAGVRGRAQLAEQPQLLERRLELRAEHAPLDPLDRAERGLDRRPLPLGAEVRAQPRAQVAGPADVEHLVVRGRGRGRRRAAAARRGDERPLRRRAAAPAARRELDERRRPSARRAPARGRAARAGSRPSPGRRRARGGRASSTVPKKYASEASPTRRSRPSSSRRASQTVSTTGAAIRRPVSRSDLAVEEARSKRALWATRTASPANSRNRRTASSTARRAAQRRGSIPVSAAIASGQRLARVDERLEPLGELERPHAHGADLADRATCRARGRSSRGRRRRRSPPRAAASAPGGSASPTQPPRQARRASPSTTSSSSSRASPAGDVASANSVRAASSAGTGPVPASTSSTSRSAASNASCTAASLSEHMFVCKAEEKAAPWRPRVRPSWSCGGAPGATALDGRLQLAAGRELRHASPPGCAPSGSGCAG